MISISGLGKRYPGGPLALDDLSIEIEGSSFFTLLGPSGCGKSTLLRCLAGLETPDAGDIAIHGAPVFSAANGIFIPPHRRKLGMVFQSYAIWPHLSVYANVSFPLEVRKQQKVRERTLRALALVGLEGLADRDAAKLSGGQQQRVALARAIVSEPDVLLLDEPLSNLDAALRDQMRAELLNLQRTLRMTTVYVTHDQTEALSMSDRIAVMSAGRLVELASPEDLYHRPRTMFAAKFIGGANIVEGRISRRGEEAIGVETSFGMLMSADLADDPQRETVQLFIRPERVLPLVTGAPAVADFPVQNLLSVVVKSRRFAGESVELDLDCGGSMLRCRCSSSVGAAAGESLRVAIDPRDIRVLQQ